MLIPLLCLKPKPLRLSLASFFFSTVPSATLSATIFRQCKSLASAKLVHQQLLVQGLPHDPTHVISMYLTFNSPANALSILRRLQPSPSTVFWWNGLIKRSVHLGFLEDVLQLYRRMQRLGWRPDHYTFPFVLKACGEIPSFQCGASVHAVVLVSGFEWNVFVGNGLVAMYGRCGALDDARQVFDEMRDSGVGDLVSWNSIVAAYIQGGDSIRAMRMFERMTEDFGIRPDAVSLVNVLPACASVGAWWRGKQVHGYAVRSGLSEDVFVGNAVVAMYAKCGMMEEANNVYERMKIKDVVSWNAMVTGYSQIGRFDDALALFEKIREDKIELNVVTWSAVISGYAQRGLGWEALDVFRKMLLCRSQPNVVTLVSLLSGCASAGALHHGKETHCYATKWILNLDENDPGDDLMVINALIDMYSKCKSPETARAIFDLILPKDRTVVTWTVLIGGHAQHGEAGDALQLFSEMLQAGNSVMPNAFTISCALMACSRLGALRFGKQIHAYVLRNHFESAMLFVANCLIDMYSKSGDVDAAQVVFDNMHQRNRVSWTSLMTGYGMHGRGEEALLIFDRMQGVGLVPDGVTFVVVLYACSHSGMIDQGISYFNGMNKDFGVVPEAEHYTCMVDLLGRAGRLDEAMELIEGMPMKPTPAVWISLLSACRVYANVELGEYAANRLSELDSGNDGTYTLLSNIYANAKCWKDVARIRSLMKNTGIKKRPGYSWVQGRKGTATFYAGDWSHPMSQQIYDLLSNLIQRIKALGYIPDNRFALHDVDDEEKGDLLSEHSEKLALAYGILTTDPGAPIRIIKNLRACGDCHSAFSYISTIIPHEIIVRDSSRFHHFKDGSCSCRGYW